MAEENTATGPTGPLSIGDAAQKLAGLMPPPEEQNAPEPSDIRTTESEEAPVEAAEEPEADDTDAADDEGEAEAEADEAGDDEPDDDASEDDPDDEAEPEPELFTVKIDGKESQVSREELVAGYQLSRAAQSRMNEAAEMRKAAEATHRQALEEQQRVAQARDQYLARLREIDQQYSNVQEPDWNALAQQAQETGNWETVVQQQLAWQQIQADRARIVQERQKTEAQRAAEAKAAQEQAADLHRKFLEAEQQRLLERLPAWKDPEKAQADKAEMRTLAKQYYGIPDDELNQISRADHVLVLRDAIAWRKHRVQAKKVQKKVATAPKVAEPKTAPAQRPKADRERSAAMNRLRREGSVNAAAEALLRMG